MRIIGTIEFAKRNITIDQRPFNPDAYPHLIDPAERIDREHGATVLLMMSPQKGKTLLAQLHVARNAAVWPVRTLWYSPTFDDSKAISDEKLSGLLASIPQVTRHLPTVIDEQGGKALIRYIDAPVTLLGASILSHRNSRSGQVLVLDESWQYEPGAISEIYRRSEAPSYKWDRRIIHTLTGPTEGTEAARLWKDSSQHTWHSICPHCKSPHVIERSKRNENHGIMWDANESTMTEDGRWRPEKAAATARWVCPSCQVETKWTEATRKWMNDPANGARYIQLNPEPQEKLYGYRINAWAFDSWMELVAEWLRAVNLKRVSLEDVEDFVRKKDVRTWELRLDRQHTVDYPHGEYMMADKWEFEGVKPFNNKPIRFLTVDVQSGHFWAVVRQWSNVDGHHGESRLLAFDKLLMPSDIEDLRVKWNVDPICTWIDSAWNTFSVAEIASRYGYTMFDAIGEFQKRDWLHSDGIRRIYSEWRTYEATKGGKRVRCRQIIYSSPKAKDLLKSIRDNKHADGTPLWTIPKNTPHAKEKADDYRSQAWAHIQVEVPTAKGGKKIEWQNVYTEDHAADLEVAQAVAALVGGYVSPPTEVESEKHDS